MGCTGGKPDYGTHESGAIMSDQLPRKNGKSDIGGRVERIRILHDLWIMLDLNYPSGIWRNCHEEVREAREKLYAEIAIELCGDDVPEFETMT